jgi:hypothetical protein
MKADLCLDPVSGYYDQEGGFQTNAKRK